MQRSSGSGHRVQPIYEILTPKADAAHISASSEDGDGAVRAMTACLEEAKIAAASVGYVNAHATSTPLGDASEARALMALFGSSGVMVSSTKVANSKEAK